MDPTLHPLHRDETRNIVPGEFDAGIVGDALHIAPTLHALLLTRGVRTVEEFVSYLQSFPADLARALGWTEVQLTQATDALRKQLEGWIDAEILDPPQQPARRFGALIPSPRKGDD